MARKHPSVPDSARNGARGENHAPRPPDSAKKPRRRLSSRTRATLIVAAVWVVFAGGIVLSSWLSDLPDTRNLLTYEPGNDNSVLDAKGVKFVRRGLTH